MLRAGISDKALIHWIDDSLATASWTEARHLNECHLVDVRSLVDKEGNTAAAVSQLIDDAIHHLSRGDRVVICCDYGISRSNAIAAGVLARKKHMDVDDALNLVMQSTGQKAIRLEVIAAVRQALGAPSQRVPKTAVLVTGAHGFLGSSFLRALSPEVRVLTPTRTELDLRSGAIQLDRSLRDKEVHTVVHLAAPRVYTTNDSLGESLVMLKNVLDACSQNGSRLVYVSSWEIYSGYQSRAVKANEDLAPRPGSTYGHAKHLAECLIQSTHERTGIEYAIVRSSPVYGPNSPGPKFLWNFLNRARNGLTITTHTYRNGAPELDLLQVKDFSRALLQVLTSNFTGTLNIGTGIGVSTRQVAELLIRLTGSQSRLESTFIDATCANVEMDISRARSLLGWQPLTQLSDGLAEIVRTTADD